MSEFSKITPKAPSKAKERDPNGLQSELSRLKNWKKQLNLLRSLSPVTGVIICFASIIAFIFLKQSEVWIIFGTIYFSLTLFIAFLPIYGGVDDQIDTLENEILLSSTDTAINEQRSQRLFKTHEIELRRYYTQALRHGTMIFIIGIVCILIGFGIVFYTLDKLWTTTELPRDDKIIVATFGFMSGIMTSFVGAVFLKMFESVMSSINIFHERLVTTNRLYFANFVITKIKDKELREKAICKLALTDEFDIETSDEEN